MIRFGLALFMILMSVFNLQAQTDSLKFPRNPTLSKRFKEAIQEQSSEYNRLFHKDSTTKHYPVSFMLDKIDNDSDYTYMFIAEFWIAFHYSEIIPDLIKRLTNKKEVGLVNYADLIIGERIKTGQMKYYGHGGISRDDLFTVAGRASYLLRQITGEDFGYVSMYSTPEQLKALQKKWIRWLRNI